MATVLHLENGTVGSHARSAVGKTGPGALQIRPIRGDCELDETRRLVHDAYLASGLIGPQPGGRLIYYPHLDGIPETTILVAELNGVIVGTSTVTCDGPAGLHLDEEYPAELHRIRGEHRRLASSWRLAVRWDSRMYRSIFLHLLRANVGCMKERGVETCLATVLPRIVPLYRRMLGLRVVGPATSGQVCEADSLSMFRCQTVLMRGDLENLPRMRLAQLETIG